MAEFLTPLCGFEVSFPHHGRWAGGMVLVVDQLPRAAVFGGRGEIGIVLVEPSAEIRGRPDIEALG